MIKYVIPVLVRNAITYIAFYAFAKIMKPSDFAIFSILFVYVPLLSSILIISLVSGFARYYYEFQEEKLIDGVKIISLLIVFFISIFIFGFKRQIFSDNIQSYVPLLLAISAASSLSDLYLTELRFAGKLKLFFSMQISVVLIFLVSIFAILQKSLTISNVLLVYLVQFSFPLVWFVKDLLPNLRWVVIKRIFSKKEQYKKIIKYSLFILPGNIGYFINDSADKLIMNKYLNPNDVAAYAFTYQFALIILYVCNVIVRIGYMPNIIKNHKNDKIGYKINKDLKIFTIFYLLIFICLSFLSEYFYLNFSPIYLIALKYFPLMLASIYFSIISSVIVASIHLSEKSYLDTLIELGSGAISFILALVLIENNGISGGFYSTYLAMMIRWMSYHFTAKIVYPRIVYSIKKIMIASGVMLAYSIYLIIM